MIKVLDNGYVELIKTEGEDCFIAETARMSTATEGSEDANARLVTRLIRDEHTSPVEFVGFVFQIKTPIFVGRQWIRHRAGVFNEFSGRYSEFGDDYYVPALERLQLQSTFNKQGSAEALPTPVATVLQDAIREQSDAAFKVYKSLIETGLTRELARIVLPVNYYTVYRWRVNLHNLFHFLRLREDSHAQWEIREYANAIHKLCVEHFPIATKAFEDHIQNRVVISRDLANQLANMASFKTWGSSEANDFIRSNKNEG